METQAPQETIAKAVIATEPVVRCKYSALVDPKELKPHPMNPNEHPAKQIELFINIMSFSGVRRPVTVSNRSGFITKGHGQVEAYLKAGWNNIPVDYQDYDSEEQELADIAADNELQRMSAMNFTKLQHLMVHLDTGAFNMEMTGFDTPKLEKLFTTFKKDAVPALSGTEGAPVVGDSPTLVQGGMVGSPDAPAGAASEASGNHVRMVQLFFSEATISEFMQIVEYFQKVLLTENVTQTVLEVLRSACRSHQQSTEQNPEANPPNVAAP